MNTLARFAVSLVPLLLSASCGGAEAVDTDGLSDPTPSSRIEPLLSDPTFAARLYALPRTEYTIPQVGKALDALLSARPRLDNIILFVHGRACGGGGEPQKSLSSVVPELESNYSAAVLLLYWPGSDSGCPLGFPESSARAAGPALRYLISQIDRYRTDNPSKLATVRLSLLTHSMGNIVLQSALEGGSTGVRSDLFSTVVLNSSATALAGHDAWLARLDFGKNVYVTVNSGDSVLAASSIGRGPRLGRQLDTAPLTARADYVDVSASRVNHQYYVRSGMKGKTLPAFYNRVLDGLPYDFAMSTAVTRTVRRSGATIYFFDGK